MSEDCTRGMKHKGAYDECEDIWIGSTTFKTS